MPKSTATAHVPPAGRDGGHPTRVKLLRSRTLVMLLDTAFRQTDPKPRPRVAEPPVRVRAWVRGAVLLIAICGYDTPKIFEYLSLLNSYDQMQTETAKHTEQPCLADVRQANAEEV